MTLDDINNAIKEIVDDQNQVCIVFGPTQYDGKPYTMPSADQFKKWIENAQQQEYTNENSSKQVDPVFMKKLPKKGKILSKHTAANGYTEYLLSNGIKVSARQSDIEPNRLSLSR